MKAKHFLFVTAVVALCACSSEGNEPGNVPEDEPENSQSNTGEQVEALALRPLNIVENETSPFNAASFEGGMTDEEAAIGQGMQNFAFRLVKESSEGPFREPARLSAERLRPALGPGQRKLGGEPR